MLKTSLIAVLLLLAAVLLYATTLPDTFYVARTVDIRAAPEKIFPLINDLHQWEAWTPYNKDPSMTKSYSGPARGSGAGYAWQGNKEVGKGSIEITGSTAPTQVALALHMMEPFEGRNRVVFTLDAAGDNTSVTWAMDGTQNFVVKVMSLFYSLDKMVGKDFELGLSRLKAVAEK